MDGFNFEIVNLPFLDGDALASLPKECIFCSLFVLRECSNVCNFNNKYQFLTAMLLKQGYQLIKFANHFLIFTTNTQSYLLNAILV